MPSSRFSLRPVAQLSLFFLAAWVGLATPPAAQNAQQRSCADLLPEAEALYVEQEYDAVEPLVDACAFHPEADVGEVTRAYRLLALSFVRRGLLAEAQLTVVKLFGANYGYEPDPIQDPPTYVALVSAVREQLQVTAPAPAPSDERQASEEENPTSRGKVNINLASSAALQSLSGIGPVLAGRIIEYREAYGPFRSVEELIEVRGIGPSTLERLAPHVTVEGPTSSQTAANAPLGQPLDAPPPARPDPQDARPPAVAQPLLVNINTATAAQLERLVGVGPVLAARIIAYREANGPFRRVEDLEEVQGIGPLTLERLAPQVTVGPGGD